MILFIVCDLSQPGRNYEPLCVQLETADGGFYRLWESVWLIDTLEQPKWWRDELRCHGDPRDRIIVSRLHQPWAALQVDGATRWLLDPARRW